MTLTSTKYLVALVLLAGVQSSYAALCGSTGTLAAAGTCTCPTGTGIITTPSAGGAVATAWTSVTATGTTTVTATSTGLTPALAAAACSDLLPGYAAVLGSVQSTATISQVIQSCTTPGTYCLGLAGAFTNAAGGISGANTNAILASSTGFTGTFTVTAGGAGTAANCPTGTTGTATSGLTSFTTCTNMAPGYQLAAGTTFNAAAAIALSALVTACSSTATYCPGLVNVFSGTLPSGTGITGAGSYATTATLNAAFVLVSTTTFGTTSSVNTITIPTYSSTSSAGNSIALTCPTGSTSASPYTSCGSLAPGYYIAAGTAAGGAPSPCPAGSYCLGSAVESPSIVNGVISVAATAAFGATACPTGTTNALALAAQIPAATSSTAATSAAVCDDLAPGYYLTATVTGVTTGSISTLTAAIAKCTATNYCPGYIGLFAITAGTVVGGTDFTFATQAAPTTIATGQFTPCTGGFGAVTFATSAATGCASIAAGQYLPAGSLTPTPCAAAAGSYCPGFSTASGVTLAANAVSSNTATTASGVVSCPIYATGSATAQSTAALACTDLVAGYALVPGVTSTKLASIFQTCPTGATCAGLAGFFGGSNAGFVSDANLLIAGVGGTASSKLVLLNTTDITTAVTTVTSVTAAATAPLLGLVNPGYFILPNGYTPVVCPNGSYCSGGDYLGDPLGAVIGFPSPCPAGSLTVATNGCQMILNFYASTANTVSLCPANNYCPGTGYLGVAGGSFPCTANSTIALCNDFLDNIQSSSYAAGSTTVTAAPAASAPAVTVSPAAVTVTPAPVTVTTAPVTVTPASQPITINVTIPAVSAASTRSSALVLVLAALAALAAF